MGNIIGHIADESRHGLLVARERKSRQDSITDYDTIDDESGMLHKENWGIVLDLITPGNLLELGNPDYEDLAACLGDNFLARYRNGPGRESNDNIKLSMLLDMWKREQSDEDHLVSTLIKTLNDRQKRRRENGLNLLISRLETSFCHEHPEYSEDEDPILRAVSWAAYRALQSKGVYEDFQRVKKILESFVIRDKGYQDITDFDQCYIVRLRTLNKQLGSKALVDYKILIQEVNGSDDDLYSRYEKRYEHVLVSKTHGCMRVISSLQKNGQQLLLCRNHFDIGISREDRLPEIEVDSVNDDLYRVDAEEVY